MQVTISPGPLHGEVPAIPSKSHAHRVLICASLADAPCQIQWTRTNDDMEATLACLEALGAKVDRQGDLLTIHPIANARSPVDLDVQESGTTLRLLLPVVAGLGVQAVFHAGGRLPDRPLTDLVQALRQRGATIGSIWPLSVQGPVSPGRFEIPGNVSSQYLSGLLLAAPLLGGDVTIHLTSPLESRPYVDLTLAVMANFGIQVDNLETGFHIPQGQNYQSPQGPIVIEGDWSQAAFFLVAGAFAGPVTVTGLTSDSLQGDKAILDALRAFGAQVEAGPNQVTISQGGRAPLHVSMEAIPDLLPILSILGAASEGDSLFDKALRLRYKESDRLTSSQAMIRSLGGQAQCREDALEVFGQGQLQGGLVQAYQDHRIVMAAAIAAGICQEPVTIDGAQAVNKSYPDFFHDFACLGGICHGI